METLNITKRIRKSCLLLSLSALTTSVMAQGQIDPIVDAGVQRTEAV